MALTIPTTQQSVDRNLAGLEGPICQTSPLNEKSFLRVLAIVLGMIETSVYKMGAERSQQNLALTATGGDLDRIGAEYNTPRHPSASTQVTVTLPATSGTTIPATNGFIAAANGLQYNLSSAAVASASGVVTMTLTCEIPGVVGNLAVGDTLNIVSPVAGAESTATVTALTVTGADEETNADYKPRVLFAEWSTTGGSNATDHKIWAQGVTGVVAAFPFAGKPPSLGLTSYPGDRTVYVECDTSINPDGIPTAGLLAQVRTALTIDPVTSLSRPTLGLTDSTLYVQPITRTSFNVTIANFVYPSGQEATIKAAILTALTTFFQAKVCYVEGVDLQQSRNDAITTPSVSEAVQSVLSVMGASASLVSFQAGSTSYNTYTLAPGELAKIGTITYVTV